MIKGPRGRNLGLGVARDDFVLLLLQGGRVRGNSLGVSTLQAAQSPYMVNNGPKRS